MARLWPACQELELVVTCTSTANAITTRALSFQLGLHGGCTTWWCNPGPLHQHDSIATGIQNDSHARTALLWPLEERDSTCFELLAHGGHVVHEEGDVTKSLWITVAIVHLE